MSSKVDRDNRNEIPTAGTAIQCARSRIQWPNSPMIRNAANGRSGMSAYFILYLRPAGPVAALPGYPLLGGSCHRATRTCSDGFPVAAPRTRVCRLPLRPGPARCHPPCNGSPAQSLSPSQPRRLGCRLFRSARVPCGATRSSTLYLLRTSSPFHQVELFGGDGGFAAVERDDDRQPHGDFRRRDREREEDEDLARDVVQVVREGHEVDVRGVQHQLDGEEDHDDVSPDQHADDTGDEDDRAEDHVGGQRRHRTIWTPRPARPSGSPGP